MTFEIRQSLNSLVITSRGSHNWPSIVDRNEVSGLNISEGSVKVRRWRYYATNVQRFSKLIVSSGCTQTLSRAPVCDLLRQCLDFFIVSILCANSQQSTKEFFLNLCGHDSLFKTRNRAINSEKQTRGTATFSAITMARRYLAAAESWSRCPVCGGRSRPTAQCVCMRRITGY